MDTDEDDDGMDVWGERRPWGVVFGIALLVVFGAVTVSAFAIGDLATKDETSTLVNVTTERVVYAKTVEPDPGAIAVAERARHVGDPLEQTAFYAVPAEAFATIVDGSEPEAPYDALTNVSRSFHLGSARVETPPEGGSIGFVYVYENATDVPVPEGGEAQDYYRAWARTSVDHPSEDRPVIVAGWADTVHGAMLAVGLGAATIALAAGAMWVHRLWQARRDEEGPLERSLSLAQLAGEHLHYQRTLLWIATPALLLGFWFTMQSLSVMASSAGPHPAWWDPFERIALGAWAMLAVGWLVLLVRVHRDRASWRKATSEPPFEL